MPTPPRILVVDDDVDTRDLLALALTRHGYAVEPAANADEALGKLRASRFELVLTDYDMPGRTGTALLAAAQDEGLLGSTPALMLTAHPKPDCAAGVEVLSKPLDLDGLLGQIEHLLLAPRADGGAAPPPRERAEPIELVLYVAKGTPASDLARQNLDRVLKLFRPTGLRIALKDPTLEPSEAERDRVVFTPTLVKRAPLPRTWILGDLGDPSVLIDLLESSGFERTG